jgi:uncharacterized repeat protein (TIGR03837 family)
MPGLSWDVYCRVVDNLGDAGVCWRLAAGLAARGQRVRLVIDDAAPLVFMAPGGAAGVEVLPWPGRAEPGEVVIEAFGCDPPPATVGAMARRATPPPWINLEYLSAEAYVERSHGLPSPQLQGPGRGLTKWFYYPGFTPRTGGLLREPGLLAERAAFDRQAWWQAQGIVVQPGERVVTLFCYDNPALPALLQDLARQPTLLLLTQGPAQRQVTAAPAGLRLHRLPWLSQPDFDRLLWSADLNFVRGEDSLVRAVWAGAPFVWQAYPQHDGAHAAKLDALLQAWRPPPAVAALWQAWNGLRAGWPGLPAPWAAETLAWRESLLARPDLVTQLIAFAAAHPGKP